MLLNKKQFIFIFTPLIIIGFFLLAFSAWASSNTTGYAWAENIGWINFQSTNGTATVADNGLTGYVWAENAGWIKLGSDAGPPYSNTNSTDWGVTNDGAGNLSGYGWGENIGWVNFHPADSQVTIDGSGNFSGYAWGENVGWIKFNHSQTASIPATTWAPPVCGDEICNGSETTATCSADCPLISNTSGTTVVNVSTSRRGAQSGLVGNWSFDGTAMGNSMVDSFECGGTVTGLDSQTYGMVAVGSQCFMDRNLGATQVATSSNDYLSYGSLYQWGRLGDGHQLITCTGPLAANCSATNGVTFTGSAGDTPPNSLFIATTTPPYDWRNSRNDTLWQSTDYVNNPCPSGWHVPLQTEWATAMTILGLPGSCATGSQCLVAAANSILKLPAAGYRYVNTGALDSQNTYGKYWSSSPHTTNAYDLNFNSTNVNPAIVNNRAYGFTVRCVHTINESSFSATDSATDLSGNANTGWLNGGVAKAVGVNGQGLSFDGVNDYVEMNAGPTSIKTETFWVKLATSTTGFFVNINDDPTYIWSNAGTVTATGFTGSTVYVNGQSASAITSGSWYFITVTHSTAENASNLEIGRTNNANYMGGIIDEVRVYNRVLTQTEITELYNIGAARMTVNTPTALRGTQSGLVANWSFDGAAMGTTSATDLSGNSKTGWLNGGTAKVPGINGQGLSFDGVNDYVDAGDVYNGVKTVAFWVKADGTTDTSYFKGKLDEVRFYSEALSASQISELYNIGASRLKFGGSAAATALTSARPSSKILDLNGVTASSTIYIEAINGTITTYGITSPTIYVDGNVSSTIDKNWRFIVVTTGTGINANPVGLGIVKPPLTCDAIVCGTSCTFGGLTYGTVMALDGKCWLDRNLGATQVATSKTDWLAYGSLFQWGRLPDGHQLITHTSATAATADNGSTAINADVPGDALFITEANSPYDWRVTPDGTLWASVSSTNNPCPSGFRVPTRAEWQAFLTAEGIYGAPADDDAFASSLKLTLAGAREDSIGDLVVLGSAGYYWTSTINEAVSYYLSFTSTTSGVAGSIDRAMGHTVRCLKN